MISSSKYRSFPLRHRAMLGVLFLLMSFLFIRLCDLMIKHRSFLLNQGEARSVRVIEIPAYRGMITDRNGEPLAISTPVVSVCANPKEIDWNNSNLNQLASLLEMPYAQMKEKITRNPHREFLYLKRQINPSAAQTIKNLKISGVFLQPEFRRYYPDSEMTAHVLGITNIDDHGQEGLELAFDDWLRGIPGKRKVLKDRLGDVVEEIAELQPPKPGKSLVLSIDRQLQYLAYRELKEAVTRFQAAAGSVVLLDVTTGEVLAMVNQPSFNPNNRQEQMDGRHRNRVITDEFEPGSTIKPFSVLAGLASGKFTPESKIDTYPGSFKVEGKVVKDIHNYGLLDIGGILQRSSNVGVSKIILSLPPELLVEMLRKFGFGQQSGIIFPGERSGKLAESKTWKPFAIAALSFGYGMSVTVLQLARAYAALVGDGMIRPVSLLRLDEPPKGESVVPKKYARQVSEMLESVIEKGGTATRAHIPGYRVIGKTGTVRLIGTTGYQKEHHLSIFVGAVPASRPRLVAAIVIQDPKGESYYGGLVSAPVFARIMSGALHRLHIPPDQTTN